MAITRTQYDQVNDRTEAEIIAAFRKGRDTLAALLFDDLDDADQALEDAIEAGVADDNDKARVKRAEKLYDDAIASGDASLAQRASKALRDVATALRDKVNKKSPKTAPAAKRVTDADVIDDIDESEPTPVVDSDTDNSVDTRLTKLEERVDGHDRRHEEAEANLKGLNGAIGITKNPEGAWVPIPDGMFDRVANMGSHLGYTRHENGSVTYTERVQQVASGIPVWGWAVAALIGLLVFLFNDWTARPWYAILVAITWALVVLFITWGINSLVNRNRSSR